MHWFEEWREKNGVSRLELARAINVSEGLIWKLEIGLYEITHPLIANDIANYTGATADQRDSLVHKKHRGTWKPDPNYRRPRQRRAKKPDAAKARPVIALNLVGAIEGVFDNEDAAAKAYAPCTSRAVRNRCTRKGDPYTDEFQPYYVTFRYADEWLSMSPKQQEEDMVQASLSRKRKAPVKERRTG